MLITPPLNKVLKIEPSSEQLLSHRHLSSSSLLYPFTHSTFTTSSPQARHNTLTEAHSLCNKKPLAANNKDYLVLYHRLNHNKLLDQRLDEF